MVDLGTHGPLQDDIWPGYFQQLLLKDGGPANSRLQVTAEGLESRVLIDCDSYMSFLP